MSRKVRTRRSAAEKIALPRPVAWLMLGSVLVIAGVCAIAPGLLGIVPALSRLPFPGLYVGQTGDIVGTTLVAAGLVAARYAAFARLAQLPGPVEVTVPTAVVQRAADDPESGAELDDLLAEFRRALIAMSVPTTESVPAAPEDDGFLNDVTAVADKQGNWLATAAGLVSALLQIRHAYRVSIQPRRTSGPSACGVTVHVVVRPGIRGTVDTVWAGDWAAAAELAAHRVGAFIVVRSRLSRAGTWSGWHGLEMPPDLFHYTELGLRCLGGNRFEEAIGHFHHALKLDPKNPYLRIRLAQAQEQIGLYLDALAGYADVVAIERWHDRRLWQRINRLVDDRTADGRPRRATRSVHGRNALLVARYRLVARLVGGSAISRTWERSVNEDDDLRRTDNLVRARERIVLRRRVTVWLKPYYDLYCMQMGFVKPLPFLSFGRNPDLFRHFLNFVGCAEVMHLVDDYRWTSGRRRPGMPVTQTAIHVMRVWAPLHLDLAEISVPPKAWEDCRRPPFRPPLWPPSPAEVDRRLQRVLRRKPSALREWQEHYNAACAVAVTLIPPGIIGKGSEGKQRETFAVNAVRHLERAISASDSRSVSTYAQWLSTGDEDLRHLRPTASFIDFLERYLPNPAPRLPRPDRLVPLLLSLHTLTLIDQYIRLRIEVLGRTGGTVTTEIRRETEVREIVKAFLDNDQDWASRLALIEDGRAFCSRHDLPEFSGRLPSFQDDPGVRNYETFLRKRAELVDRGLVPNHPGPVDDRRILEDYYRDVVEHRRASRSKLIAAVPQPNVNDDSRLSRLTSWTRFHEVVGQSFLPETLREGTLRPSPHSATGRLQVALRKGRRYRTREPGTASPVAGHHRRH